MKSLFLSVMIGLACTLAACTSSPGEQSPPAAQDPDLNMINNAL